ncbi:MAG: hypothetical protein WD267_11505 [Balneolales bacterium]
MIYYWETQNIIPPTIIAQHHNEPAESFKEQCPKCVKLAKESAFYDDAEAKKILATAYPDREKEFWMHITPFEISRVVDPQDPKGLFALCEYECPAGHKFTKWYRYQIINWKIGEGFRAGAWQSSKHPKFYSKYCLKWHGFRDAGFSFAEYLQSMAIGRIPEQKFEELVEAEDPPTLEQLAKIGRQYLGQLHRTK